jgi:GT2 family glycosyltransferase
MARFEKIASRLDPYGSVTNQARSRRVHSKTFRDLGPKRKLRPGLSVVVLNLNRPDLVESLWRGIEEIIPMFEAEGLNIEFLIGDTGSSDPRTLWCLNSPSQCTRIFRHLEYQFSRCNNDLFREIQYQTVLFLNNDVLIEQNPNALMLAYAKYRENTFAAMSAVLLFDDQTVQHAGIDFFEEPELYGFCFHPGTREWWRHDLGRTWTVPAGTGAFLMTDASLFSLVGGFDEDFRKECQDIDLCLKYLRLGFENGMVDLGPLVHLENGTRELGEEDWADRALYTRRWNSFVESL